MQATQITILVTVLEHRTGRIGEIEDCQLETTNQKRALENRYDAQHSFVI